MSPCRSSALLGSAALVLGVALAPAVAFADASSTPTPTTDAFTNADLVSALTAAEASTVAAAKAGWIAQGTATEPGASADAIKAVYAVSRAAVTATGLGTLIQAEHSGTYIAVSTLAAEAPDLHVQLALDAIKKSQATWVFEPESSLDLRTRNSDSLIADVAPDALLADLVDPKKTQLTGTPTKTVGGDGSTTYTFSATDLTGEAMSGTDTLTIDANDVVTTLRSVSSSETNTASFTYGPQQVALPAASQTVTFAQLTLGTVLADLPREVKLTARMVATAATHRAHKHAVRVADIRSNAKKMTQRTDKGLGLKLFTAKSIAGGVRIIGTNPFRHTRVSYTVTAVGKKAVVRKG